MTLKIIDTAKADGTCCNSTFNDVSLVTLRSCGGDPACASHIMPVSRQMNFASHTTRKRANERRITRIIQNNRKQNLCNPRTINDIRVDTNLLIPQRTNREFIRDTIFNSNKCQPNCNIGIDIGSNNLRTQSVRRRNTHYFKDSAVPASTRIDRLKAELSGKTEKCCPSINSNKQESYCSKSCSKRQPNPFLRFRR